MPENRDWLRAGMVGIFLLAITTIFLGMIRGFLESLFLAAVFSAMAMPLYRRILAGLHGRRGIASGLTIILLTIAVLLPSLLLLALMAGQAADLATDAGPWAQGAIEFLGGFRLKLPEWFPFREQLEAAGPQIASKIASFAGQIGRFLLGSVAAATQGTARFFLQLFVLLYAMSYFLTDGPAIVDKLFKMTTLRIDLQQQILTRGYVVARATIRGSMAIGLIQGFLGGLGFWIFGVPNFVLWGAVMAISSLIPGIGTAIVWIPAVIYLFATGATLPAAGLLVWSAVLVGTVDNVLRPTLVGGEAKMPDLVILVSTFGGLATFGATGLILGPVIAGVFFTAWEVFSAANQPEAETDAE
jgi:predicted PurR-regulated permease PerM